MYDDIAIMNKTRFADSVIESIEGDIFVIFSHDMVPWFALNGNIQKATWIPPLYYPVKRFAIETIIHTKAGFSMPRILPSIKGIVNPVFDDPSMIVNEAKTGFIKTYLTWANALLVNPDEIYGIGFTFSIWSPIIGIGDIRLRDVGSDKVEYDFHISYQFNESVPLIDALAEFIVKKDDDEEEGGLV